MYGRHVIGKMACMARHQIPHGGKGSVADDIAGHAFDDLASNAHRRHALMPIGGML
jgi:hypothetical protein